MLSFYLFLLAFCQVFVLVFYLKKPSTNPDSWFWSLFHTPKHLAVVNFAAAISIFSINRIGQYFCVPVTWASVILILLVLSMVFYEFVKKDSYLDFAISFIHGIGILVCIYCLIFYNGYSLVLFALVLSFFCAWVGFVFIGTFLVLYKLIDKALKINRFDEHKIGATPMLFWALTVALPLVWLIQIVKRLGQKNVKHKALASFSFVLMLVFTGFFISAHKKVTDNKTLILSFDEKKIRELQSDFFTNYMLERAMGWAMIYHTELCVFDGWRPPMHDPFLVVSDWFLKKGEPLDSDFETKKKLYKAFYPQISIKKKCSCAIEESEKYFSSSILEN